jgi:hypothetical protein
MTRSHVLLHFPNARLAAARMGVWEGGDPGGVGPVVQSPLGEATPQVLRAIRSGKRVMEDGTDSGIYDGRVNCVGDGRGSRAID